jgi:hypothetical protein
LIAFGVEAIDYNFVVVIEKIAQRFQELYQGPAIFDA